MTLPRPAKYLQSSNPLARASMSECIRLLSQAVFTPLVQVLDFSAGANYSNYSTCVAAQPGRKITAAYEAGKDRTIFQTVGPQPALTGEYREEMHGRTERSRSAGRSLSGLTPE